MKNIFFPRVEVQNPSEQLKQVYSQTMTPKKNVSVGVLLILVWNLFTVSPSLFLLENKLVFVIYLLPSTIMILFNLFLIFKRSFFWMGALLLLISIPNFMLIMCSLLIAYQLSYQMMAIIIYYASIIIFSIWTIIYYRKHYKNFEQFSLISVKQIQQSEKKTKADIFLGGIIATVIGRFIAGSSLLGVFAIVGIYITGYYMIPLIAERIIVTCQCSQMKKFISE